MLNFKAKNIAKVEKESGVSFFELLENMSQTSNLTLIIQAGGKTEDEAFDLIDEKGFDRVILMVMEGLGEAGFLPEAIRAKLKTDYAKVEKSMEELEKVSSKSGETTK